MKTVHNIRVAGNDLSLCSENDAVYVEKLAEELSRRISTIELSGANVTKVQAAIVCALDLLDENYRLKSIIEDKDKDDKK